MIPKQQQKSTTPTPKKKYPQFLSLSNTVITVFKRSLTKDLSLFWSSANINVTIPVNLFCAIKSAGSAYLHFLYMIFYVLLPYLHKEHKSSHPLACWTFEDLWRDISHSLCHRDGWTLTPPNNLSWVTMGKEALPGQLPGEHPAVLSAQLPSLSPTALITCPLPGFWCSLVALQTACCAQGAPSAAWCLGHWLLRRLPLPKGSPYSLNQKNKKSTAQQVTYAHI